MSDPRLNHGDRRKPVRIRVDGREVRAFQGETVMAALIAAGVRTLKHSKEGHERGGFCGMGVCFECRVRIDGRPEQACLTVVEEGMEVLTHGG